jgi:hypothetical protein
MVTNHVNVGHAPFFNGDGSNFDYWKTCMRIHLKAMGGIIWKVVDEGYVILNEANPTHVDNENLLANAQAMNVIIRALCIHEYHRVCKLETAHEMWGKLIEDHEGTSNVKSAKLFICKGKFEKFTLLSNEELKDSFSRLNNIMNELKNLGCKPWKIFGRRNRFLAVEIGPGGLTASPYSRAVWLLGVAGQTVSPCIDRGLTATRAGQTATYSNGRNFDLKVAVTSLAVW